MSANSKTLLALVATSALLAGCDNSNNDNATPAAAQTASLRVIHASPDAPNVKVSKDGTVLAQNLGYKQATALAQYAPGTASLKVDAILPGGTATVIGPVNVTLAADTQSTVLAVGEVGAGTLKPLVITHPASQVASGYVRATVVHAAPNAPAVDVYVTDPTANLAASTKLGKFAFGEQIGPATIPLGTYRIRVTLPDQPATVVFDSGRVTFDVTGDVLLTAVKNTGPGAAPISLVTARDGGAFEFLDAATPGQVRVIHASPDAPPVDVIVNNDCAKPVLQNVPFPAFSNYLSVPPATYNVKVTAAGNCGAVVIDANLQVAAGKQYSVYATGPLASITPYVLTDDNRSVSTAAKVRVVHAAPSAGSVDIYVTAPGAAIAAVSPAFTNVPLRAETGYVNLAGGSYDVTVTPAGTKTPAIGPATIKVADGGVYTAAARDAQGGGAPFGLILLDGF